MEPLDELTWEDEMPSEEPKEDAVEPALKREKTVSPRRGKMPFSGAFGDWVYATRKKQRLSLADLAEVTGISKGWLSEIENGNTHAKIGMRDTLILKLGMASAEEGNALFTPNAALAAWRTDDRQLEAAFKKSRKDGGVSRVLRMSLDERRQHGKDQRLRILQYLVDDLYLRNGTTGPRSIASRLNINNGSVSAHLRKLLMEQKVSFSYRGNQIQHLVITTKGLEYALEASAHSETWRPPFALVPDVMLVAFRKLFVHRKEMAEAAPAAEDPTRAPGEPVRTPIRVQFQPGPMDSLTAPQQLVLWQIVSSLAFDQEESTILSLSAKVGLSAREATMASTALLADELVACDHEHEGVLVPTDEGLRFVLESGWDQPKIRALREPPAEPPPAPVAPRPALASLLPPARAAAAPLPREITIARPGVKVLQAIDAARGPLDTDAIVAATGLSYAEAHAAVLALVDDDLLWWAEGGTKVELTDVGARWIEEPE